MKVVYGEIKKLISKNSYWVLTGIITLFILLLFYQKGYNVNSGYYQPELCKGDYLPFFNLSVFSILINIYATFVFGMVAANDYENNTLSIVLTKLNRYQFHFSKVVACILMIALYCVFLTILGVVEGIMFSGEIHFPEFGAIIVCILGNVLISLVYGIFAYIVSNILLNSVKGIICTFFVSFVNEQIFASYFSSRFYEIDSVCNSIRYNIFPVVVGSQEHQITISSGGCSVLEQSIVLTGCFILALLCILLFLCKRDHSA